MPESLEDRIRDHATAFNGLLSLIPSKLYYGTNATNNESTDGPANMKKKKSKAEKKDAKKARLNPDSEANWSAAEVMEETGRKKRKLQELNDVANSEEDDDGDYENVEGIEPEKPREGLKPVKTKKSKTDADNQEAPGEKIENVSIDPTKEVKHIENLEARKAKLEAKKQQKVLAQSDSIPTTPAKADAKKAATPKSEKKAKTPKQTQEAEPAGTISEDATPAKTKVPTGTPTENNAEASNNFLPSSKTTSKPKIKVPIDTEAFRKRFAEKMAELKAARFKSDNPDSGKPVRTRQELIEARRQKAILRKEHKKEARQAAKREEELKREKALASNSPSVMSPKLDLDDVVGNAAANANLSFGRVAFGDGTQLSHDLSYALNRDHKKGPSDPKTALLKVQNAKKRLAAMTPEKRAQIEEQEAWLTARRRAEGEKIRDDESALKKAVKRKERVKSKSATEWVKRLDGVAKAKASKQQKREDNLQKRKDSKLERKLERAAGKKRKSGSSGGKKKARPGFEGNVFGKKK